MAVGGSNIHTTAVRFYVGYVLQIGARLGLITSKRNPLLLYRRLVIQIAMLDAQIAP